MTESRFHFDARWAVDGFFPMPCYQSDRSSELLSRLVYHAVSASPSLQVLDHWISCKIDEQVEQAAYEVLRTRFQMPCEGGETSIQTIDRIALYPDAMHYSVNETYGAYLLFAGVCDDALRRAMSTTAEPSRRLPLDEADRTFVVHALQTLHRERTTTWNCHAIHALKNNRLVQSPDTFGLAELERILAKLGATAAP